MLLNTKPASYLLHTKYAAAIADGDLVKKVTRKNPKIMMLHEKYFSSQEKVELPCKGSSELLRKLLIAKNTSRS